MINRSDIDLDAEWRAASKAADWKALQWLIGKGVPARALVSPGMLSFFVGVLDVRGAQGFWEPRADRGQRAFVMPANEREDYVDDLVAWRPGSPATFWRRTGDAKLMGEDAIVAAIEDQAPLHVFATPFEWLKNGREGLVVLDWEAHLPMIIDEVPELLVDDIVVYRRLARALGRPRRIPPIRVHRKAVAPVAVLAHSPPGAPLGHRSKAASA